MLSARPRRSYVKIGTLNNLKWVIQSTFIVSPFLNPGGYIYVEASGPQRYGHKSLLMGPRICGRMCMRFFYSMNGRRMGTLNVYKREGIRSDDLLWTMSGHQGTQWHKALVDIGGACYQVRVYGHEDKVQKSAKSRLGLSWKKFSGVIHVLHLGYSDLMVLTHTSVNLGTFIQIQSIYFGFRIQNLPTRDKTGTFLFQIHASACKRQNCSGTSLAPSRPRRFSMSLLW